MLLTGQIDASVKGPERKGEEGPAAPTLRPRWLHAGHAGDTEPLLLTGKAGPSPGSTPTSSSPAQGRPGPVVHGHPPGQRRGDGTPWGEPSTRPCSRTCNELTDLIFNDRSVELAMKKTKNVPQEMLEERC